uniref:Uncharacterized protein n=1 Tax=Strongyloides venezuelensis TaxID=75913 RepID=A0A0K0FI88_STRVS
MNYGNVSILNDNEDKNFSFFNNMGSLILIVNNFDDESCENLFEVVRHNLIEHKSNIHGLNRFKSLRLIMVNVINEKATLLEKYCTFDKISKVCLDRYNVHFNENKNGETVVIPRRQYESVNILENVKSVKEYTTTKQTVACNSSHKSLPFLIQTLPFIFIDFRTSEEVFVNDYILKGNDVLPHLVLKIHLLKKMIWLLFCQKISINQVNRLV